MSLVREYVTQAGHELTRFQELSSCQKKQGRKCMFVKIKTERKTNVIRLNLYANQRQTIVRVFCYAQKGAPFFLFILL